MLSADADCSCVSFGDVAKACCASKWATALSKSFKYLALPRPVAHLLYNRQVPCVVLDGLAKVPLRPIRVAEGGVRTALTRPVTHLLCHRQTLGVVLDGLGKVSLRKMGIFRGYQLEPLAT